MKIGSSLFDEEGAKIVPKLLEKAKAKNVIYCVFSLSFIKLNVYLLGANPYSNRFCYW
jgi:hypothetical protein